MAGFQDLFLPNSIQAKLLASGRLVYSRFFFGGAAAVGLTFILCCSAGINPRPSVLYDLADDTVLIEGAYVLASDPITRSLPESAALVFHRDGTLSTEKTGLARSWSLVDGRLSIGERMFVWDAVKRCLFSAHAPGYQLGWYIREAP